MTCNRIYSLCSIIPGLNATWKLRKRGYCWEQRYFARPC